MQPQKPKILLVDDDPQSLESTQKILELSGFEVVPASDGQAALEIVRPTVGGIRADFQLILTDVRMPRLGGLEFLRALSLCGNQIPVILMTAFGRVEDAVWAMKLGAVDFLTKPFKRQALLTSVEAALKRTQSPKSAYAAPTADDSLVGRSSSMARLQELIAQVAPTAATVLLSGESGTGKEMVAKSIHRKSARSDKPFIALNCAALPEHLIESELFGHEKGAFTGAQQFKMGLFESAHGGTLLLDEIGDMPIGLQAKLLRVLQEGEVRRVGSNQSRKVDVRVIAASHRNLRESVAQGSFRQDLLFRLEVIVLHVLPLRERQEDVLELAYHFLRKFSSKHAKAITQIPDAVMERLFAHPWPGNVRELANVIERAVIFARTDVLSVEDLPPHLAVLSGKTLDQAVSPGSISVPIGTSLRDVEDLLIRKTLEVTSGDKNMTAKLLGINSRTIYRKLDKREEKET